MSQPSPRCCVMMQPRQCRRTRSGCRGHPSISRWFLGRRIGCKGSRLVPTAACGSPAFGQYRKNGAEPWAHIVLEIDGDHIASMNYFLDAQTLFPKFGLPLHSLTLEA